MIEQFQINMCMCSVMSDCLHPHELQPARLPSSWYFSMQKYWSGVPFLTPGEFPAPGIELMSLASPELASGFFTTNVTWEACTNVKSDIISTLTES